MRLPGGLAPTIDRPHCSRSFFAPFLYAPQCFLEEVYRPEFRLLRFGQARPRTAPVHPVETSVGRKPAESNVTDLSYLVGILGFFALVALLAFGCAKLQRRNK